MPPSEDFADSLVCVFLLFSNTTLLNTSTQTLGHSPLGFPNKPTTHGIAQDIGQQIFDERGGFRFRDISITEGVLKTLRLKDSRPQNEMSGVQRVGGNRYILWLGKDILMIDFEKAHGIHRFQWRSNGLGGQEFNDLFSTQTERYAVETLLKRLRPQDYFINQGGFDILMAHIFKALWELKAQEDDPSKLRPSLEWIVNVGPAPRQIVRGFNGITQTSENISPRYVYNFIEYSKAQASSFYTERLARKTIWRRDITAQINAAEIKTPKSSQVTEGDIEDVIAYFYALKANATATLMPFIDGSKASNSFYLESMALPLYGMVNPSVFINSPFGIGPLAPAGFDAFDDIQNNLTASGNYSKSQLEYTSTTHKYMRDMFSSTWKNATAVVYTTGALMEMQNIIIFLAVTNINNPNATGSFPKSYHAIHIDDNIGRMDGKSNSFAIPAAT